MDLNLTARVGNESEAAALLLECRGLGYSGCALNFSLIPGLPVTRAKQSLKTIMESAKSISSLVSQSEKLIQQSPFSIYTRLTLLVDSEQDLMVLSDPDCNQFNLLAVCPLSDKALTQCLNRLQAEDDNWNSFDIVTVSSFGDASQVRYPPAIVTELKKRSVFLEVSYSFPTSTKPGHASETRQSFISNTTSSIRHAQSSGHSASLVAQSKRRSRKLKLTNILLSSGASESIMLRRPLDVEAIGVAIGMKPEYVCAAFREATELVLERAAVRRMKLGWMPDSIHASLLEF